MPEPAARRPRTGEFLTIGEWRQVKARFTPVIERRRRGGYECVHFA